MYQVFKKEKTQVYKSKRACGNKKFRIIGKL